jgi:DNA-binding response OmpR family regulator
MIYEDNEEEAFDMKDFSVNKEPEKKILIVENDVDLRMYIKDCLAKSYTIYESSNGKTGLKAAKEIQPDLVITDIMMPVMNGIEFCKALKSDLYTRHVPVFIHSVKSDELTFKEALDAGAEDFIGKPFNYSMLMKKINNFFKTREQLVIRTQAKKSLKPQEITIPSSNEELIKRVSVIVEKNLSNPGFGVDSLSKQLGFSRMQLHRRIVNITGKQISVLIRDIRLQRAAQLLKTGEKRISEVMWETGFNNHTRFNKYFKEKYDMNVKKYIESITK